MAVTKEQMDEIVGLIENAEGFTTDAEFREELDSKVIRYLQSICSALRAQCAQNKIIIELLARQLGEDALPQ